MDTNNGSALALRGDTDIAPATFEGMLKQADILVKSGLLPQEIKSPAAAVAVMLTGRELGIPVMQSFRSIYVVKGKPTLSAQLMGALILRDGHSYKIVASTNDVCTIEFRRKSGAAYTHTFTLEDAKRANLVGSPTWQNYPKAMLFSRCMSAGARACMPDVVANMYTPEEIASIPASGNGDVFDVVEATAVEPATQPEPAQPAPAADWTKSQMERDLFTGFRTQHQLNDADCKDLAARHMGLDEPLKFFRDFPGDRAALQAAILEQLAKEAEEVK
jgi:hypothetical protein